MPKCDFNGITLRHGCSPVNLLHIFRIPFFMNTSGRMLLYNVLFVSYKFLIVLGLYPRLYISIRQSSSHSLSKYFLASAKNKYVLFSFCI